MAGASDALSKAQKIRGGESHQEKHQVPVKRRAARLRKGDDKGLIEDAAVSPEYIQPRESETSLKRSVK
jgi:hypothetical protein